MSIYAKYRVLGLVCDGTLNGSSGSVLHKRGGKWFITSPVDQGRSLHLYDVSTLRLKGMINACEGKEFISSIVVIGDRTYAAVEETVIVFQRMREIARLKEHEDNISILIAFGDFVASVSTEEHRLIVWDEDGESVSDFFFQPDFHPTTAAHPPTYLNKLLIGGLDGRLQLWNIRTLKLIHEFKGFGSAVTVIEPSSIVDVLAIGLADGRVVLHNFRFDETILTFRHDSGQRVTSLTFRSDGDESLVSACIDGDLAVWDLNEGRLRVVSRGVHRDGVASASFVGSEPILVTSGIHDNCINIHVFDVADGSGRVLRSRSGHLAPPIRVRFCGEDGRQLVSAGLDRELRVVSTIRDAQNRVISQGKLRKKRRRLRQEPNMTATGSSREFERLPPVVDIAVGSARRDDEDFANIVTSHGNTREVYTWRLESGALAPHVLDFKDHREDSESSESLVCAVAVEIAPAGHSTYVGYSDGYIHSFNLQSGRHLSKSDEKHNARVTSLAVDSIGEALVSGSDDNTLRFWDAHTLKLAGKPLKVGAGVEHLKWSADSDLIVVAFDDLSIRVYDSHTRKLARKLAGHTSRITDVAFAENGRFILSASMDSTIRVWDLLSGMEIDRMDCESPPTSLVPSPDNAFLCTSHSGQIGITMWVNKVHFGADSLSEMQGALSQLTGGEHDGDEDADEAGLNHMPPNDLVMLSSEPVSKWTVLANLDVVKERNKPKKPVRKPEAAPFFLPTVKGLQPQFDTETNGKEDGDSRSRHLDSDSLFERSKFANLCIANQFDDAIELMKELGPSKVDVEIHNADDSEARSAILKYFTYVLETRKHFDLTEAQLGLFLKHHGTELSRDVDLQPELTKLKSTHEESWRKLQESFSMALTLIPHFSGQQ